jgi:hypothetical protein
MSVRETNGDSEIMEDEEKEVNGEEDTDCDRGSGLL